MRAYVQLCVPVMQAQFPVPIRSGQTVMKLTPDGLTVQVIPRFGVLFLTSFAYSAETFLMSRMGKGIHVCV
jgi:hypothetical protein